ncbi:alpha/beta hydrolase [Gordonia sp. HY002]|uniref:alpha/beta fold hydrolase n=1 Tax=Gordonia zhenghanii TaxID=2911516 RepID=UPI001EEFEC79|nr:alpha/beta hydrolase [Gordonia zhenghanii]MCF8571313.1 alpha/beta hydrolase [Gordonia zhenghanii]MCF8601837.1 alpha/beta hydrolase [Gordonia zhenghanii]
MTRTDTRQHFRGDGVDLAATSWSPAGPSSGIVVLLHGGGQTRHSWQRTGERLADGGWRVHAVDLRGHGESEWAFDGDYTIDAHARDVSALVSRLPEAPILVGASLGGMASLMAQSANGSLARGLVLVDITPKARPEGLTKIHDFMARGIEGFDSLDDALAAVVAYNPNRRRMPRAAGLRKNLRQRDGRWYWHWDPRILAQRENSVEAAAERESAARSAARRITVPTLLVHGAQSDVVSDDGVNDLLALIPDARHVEVRGAGHMIAGDDNDVLSGGIADFCSSLRADSAEHYRFSRTEHFSSTTGFTPREE